MNPKNCPYYDTYKKICTHKQNKIGGCINTNITKCELYIEWVKKLKKVSPSPFKSPKTTITNER